MSAADLNTGFFGKIPVTGDFVAANLPRTFIDRWDRWMSMELRERPDGGELDPRVWRFRVPAGIFCDQPCSGAWRMSEDRVGRRYPFVVVAIGLSPRMDDGWFDAVSGIAGDAVSHYWTSAMVTERLHAVPLPPTNSTEPGIVFWCDGWSVHECHFKDIHDLADNGLPIMRTAPLPAEES
ncbi:type VI secretion system-associated protein TagF [Mesorhizobium sp. M1252]|uniref:type VI secretion system-associated protein TagF n=1 Tax=Mesorhizobium sp. M1252 TaxID=2957073 RepID=UPI0033354748